MRKFNKNIPFIDLSAQKNRLGKKLDFAISTVLSHGSYIMGPEVKQLEEELKKYTNTKHVISCASGTDSLLLALMSNNIGKGDVVFCPAFTFPATAEVISLLGATPYFVDVDNVTFNISIDSLKTAILKVKEDTNLKIKGIIAVDLYGLPANYDELNNIARDENLLLIADAAQSFGAEYFGTKVGKNAKITCVSFFPAKPLGCYGDGGAVFTDDDKLAEKIKSLRVHGKGKSKYDIDLVGLNSRLDTLQAAILLVKLKEFDWEVKQRNLIANRYNFALKEIFDTPFVPKGIKSVWAQYTLKHENRDLIQKQLSSKGIPTMVYYPKPMHQQNAYKKYYTNPIENSEILSKVVFSLPMYPDMTEDIQEYIINNLLEQNV